eukprot:Protomagalhaensia_wolfi_Nauph_80__5920@NODE_778_length_2010_cov_41_749366_g586_i0_p2_GENE_NODE_778_length_2010_cov_41_749366_g586_i0NODE_778_length_2010_cov_41_749366_g586_i0_p2_ORF_typecomplete_len111_score5_02MltA/PF03562_17/0_16_NODE_778_length_2010_cov_41_749366_g586_i015971929
MPSEYLGEYNLTPTNDAYRGRAGKLSSCLDPLLETRFLARYVSTENLTRGNEHMIEKWERFWSTPWRLTNRNKDRLFTHFYTILLLHSLRLTQKRLHRIFDTGPDYDGPN